MGIICYCCFISYIFVEKLVARNFRHVEDVKNEEEKILRPRKPRMV